MSEKEPKEKKEKENGIRFEKKVLMSKRLVMGVAVEFADTFYTVLDRIKKISDDSNISEGYLVDFFLEQLRSEYHSIPEESFENVEEE